jgi:hypothetical protein
MNMVSVVRLAMGLTAEGWSLSPGKDKIFLLIQTSSGVHPASYPVGTGGSFPEGKAARAWSWPLTTN